MEQVERILTAIFEAVQPTAVVVGKGAGTAALVIVLAWYSVEHLFGLFPPLRRAGPDVKKALAMVVGQGCVLAVHGLNIVDYGAGPRGWWTAALFGFLGGALAPWLHGVMKDRFPDSTYPAPPAQPAGPGGS